MFQFSSKVCITCGRLYKERVLCPLLPLWIVESLQRIVIGKTWRLSFQRVNRIQTFIIKHMYAYIVSLLRFNVFNSWKLQRFGCRSIKHEIRTTPTVGHETFINIALIIWKGNRKQPTTHISLNTIGD